MIKKNGFSSILFSPLCLLFFAGYAQRPIAVSVGTAVKAYQELPVGSIWPKGWLLHQLQVMRDGTSGHLDEIYAKLKNDNGWLGGRGDGWEETPYWLDGALPLAYLLGDKVLEAKVLKYVDWTLEHQRPSGYFGPFKRAERDSGLIITAKNSMTGEDWWPKMVMLKVLQQYYQATQDKRVIPFLSQYFAYQLAALKQSPIDEWTEWAAARGADNVMVVQWLYAITKEESLRKLSSLVLSQSYPWTTWLGSRDWVIHAAAQQNEQDWMHRHAVNVSMGLKSPVMAYWQTGDRRCLDSLKTGFKDLMQLHGLPMGMFSCDEDLHGNAPTQGIELCAITETMFSLEKIIEATGDTYYADALERIAYNALPTQTTDDYNAKQYYQIPNQVQVCKGALDFTMPFYRLDNNVFGMLSGYTCCLTNMHQGWPKLATHLWYNTADNGLAAFIYAPNEVTTFVGKGKTKVTIKEETNYPFEDTVGFHFSVAKDCRFPLQLRIPAWCTEAVISINGKEFRREKGNQMVTVNRIWHQGDRLTLHLPMQVRTSNWGMNSRTIERGPLVYALKVQEDWQKENDAEDGTFYSIYTKDKWNYGLLKNIVSEPEKNTEVRLLKPVTDQFIWNQQNAPIEIIASAKEIPNWKIVDGVAHQPVTERMGSYRGTVEPEIKKITLIPYGCTKLRVVAFPVVD